MASPMPQGPSYKARLTLEVRSGKRKSVKNNGKQGAKSFRPHSHRVTHCIAVQKL